MVLYCDAFVSNEYSGSSMQIIAKHLSNIRIIHYEYSLKATRIIEQPLGNNIMENYIFILSYRNLHQRHLGRMTEKPMPMGQYASQG